MHDDPHTTLVRALQNPALYDHPVQGFELIQTHISSVLLTGDYAYKLKKPLDLGFLDFSTLEKRRHFCHEELRLNRRLAPQLYLEVLPIIGTPENPRFKGPGEPFEYAVKMRQFPQSAQLDRVLARGDLTAATHRPAGAHARRVPCARRRGRGRHALWHAGGGLFPHGPELRPDPSTRVRRLPPAARAPAGLERTDARPVDGDRSPRASAPATSANATAMSTSATWRCSMTRSCCSIALSSTTTCAGSM